MKIRDLIGEIRNFTKNVINVKDFYKIDSWNEAQLLEYIEYYDLNNEVIEILKAIFKIIKNKIDGIRERACIDLQGNFGTGKSHILLFLALILNKHKYTPEIQEKILNKLKERPEFFEEYEEIYNILTLTSDDPKLSGILVVPIRLGDYGVDDLKKALEIGVTREILSDIDVKETLISNNKKIITFFATDQKDACAKYFQDEEYQMIKDLHHLIMESKPVNEIKVANAVEKIDEILEKHFGLSTLVSSNPIEDLCKNKHLGRKHKYIILLFDELTQWWKKGNDELLKILQTFTQTTDDIATDHLKDIQGNLIENNIVFAIFAHQRELWFGDSGQTVRNRFEVVPSITSKYINSIIAKRFFYKDQIKEPEIKNVAESIYNTLVAMKIPEEIIESVYAVNPIPEIAGITDLKEKIIENIKSYYPFHPFLFSSVMAKVFAKFSTEKRGILNFVDNCFKLYDNLLDNEADDLINIDTLFKDLYDKKLLFKNNNFNLIYERLDKARKKRDPNDEYSSKVIKSLILKLFIKDEATKYLKDELKATFLIDDTNFEDTIEKFVNYCITELHYPDINSTTDSIELTQDKSVPIGIYIEQIKPKITEEHVYHVLKYTQEKKMLQYIPYTPSSTKNRRYKKYQLIEYNSTIKGIRTLITDKTNSKNKIKGNSNLHFVQVFDLIYYFLPPKQAFLLAQFNVSNEILNKITTNKINYVICKPKSSLRLFSSFDNVRDYISLNIINWALTHAEIVKQGVAETAYNQAFIDLKIKVPDFSTISDLLSELTNKNDKVIENLILQCQNQINSLEKEGLGWIETWLENFECHYNFIEYKSLDYSDDNLSEIEEDLEDKKYPNAITLEDNIAGAHSDYIWETIWKENEDVTSTRTTKYRNLKMAVETLKLLKLNGTTFSLIDDQDLHNNFKKFETEIGKLTIKKDILDFCHDFRLNECGMSVYLTILGLFYIYQKGKIKFYDSADNLVDITTLSAKKEILGKTHNFIGELVNKNGKLEKVQLFATDKWESIIDFLINLKNLEIIEIDEEYDDKEPIDLETLKKSQSLNRERKLFSILNKHISLQKLTDLHTKMMLFLTKIKLDKIKNIKQKLGIIYFQDLLEELKNFSNLELLYNHLDGIKDEIKNIIKILDSTKKFSESKLSDIEDIYEKLNKIVT